MPLVKEKRSDGTIDSGGVATTKSRKLGLTILRNGKELKTFFPGETITIGRGVDNDIVYYDWQGSEAFTLLARTGPDRYLLNMTEQMTGKVSYMGSDVDFRTLIIQGLLPRKNGVYQLEILEGKEGELQFGELTLKFGYISPPTLLEPVSIAEIMPARRGLTSNMDEEDRHFTYLFLTTLTLSVFFLIFAFKVGPMEGSLKIVNIPEVIAELINIEDLEDMMGVGEGEGEGTGPGGGGGGGTNYGPGTDEGPGVYGTGLLGLLTTEGPSGGPSVVDILGGGGGAGDIDAILGGIGGLTTSGSGGLLGGGGLGLGGLGGPGGMDLASLLGGGGGGGFDTSDLETAGVVTLSGPQSISGTAEGESGRSSSAISNVIGAHMSGLQSVYNAQLKKNPNLSGKIVVTFTINAQGLVTNAYISSSTMNCPEMESQVASRIYGWRFPAVSGGEVTVVYPFVFIKT